RLRAGRDDEIIVRQTLAAGETDLIAVQINRFGVCPNRLGVFLRAEDFPNRCGDIRRRKRGRRHLIQKRLENMVVVLIDERDAELGVPKRRRGVDTAKAAPEDDQVLPSRTTLIRLMCMPPASPKRPPAGGKPGAG